MYIDRWYVLPFYSQIGWYVMLLNPISCLLTSRNQLKRVINKKEEIFLLFFFCFSCCCYFDIIVFVCFFVVFFYEIMLVRHSDLNIMVYGLFLLESYYINLFWSIWDSERFLNRQIFLNNLKNQSFKVQNTLNITINYFEI